MLDSRGGEEPLVGSSGEAVRHKVDIVNRRLADKTTYTTQRLQEHTRNRPVVASLSVIVIKALVECQMVGLVVEQGAVPKHTEWQAGQSVEQDDR